MRLALAAILVALAIVAYRSPTFVHSDVQQRVQSEPKLTSAAGVQQLAPAYMDNDHDGAIGILDIANVAQYFGQHAERCLRVTREHFTTPITVYRDGTPELIEGRSYPDPADPLVSALLSGTPTFQCP